MTSSSKKEKLITHYLNTTLNEKNLGIVTEVLHSNSVNYTSFGVSIGTHKIITDFESWFNIFSDIKIKITDIMIADDTVVIKLLQSGKHIGTFKSISATGKTAIIESTISFRTDGEKILAYVLSSNLESLIKQITDNAQKQDVRQILKRPIVSTSDFSFFEKIHHHLSSIHIPLTIQQIKCLCLWVNQRTIAEIAFILHVSLKTVEADMDGIKSCLHAHTINLIEQFIASHDLKYLLKEGSHILIGKSCHPLRGEE